MTETLKGFSLGLGVRALVRVRDAQRQADQLADRLDRVAAATIPLTSAETLMNLLEAAAAGVSDVFGQPAGAVTPAEDGYVARALCTGRGGTTYLRRQREDPAPHWPAHPRVVTPATTPGAWHELVKRTGLGDRSWYAVPMIGPDARVIGSIAVAMPTGDRALTDEDTALVQRLADGVAAAVVRLQASTQRDRIALTLQEALLPDRLPVLPGLAMAARYRASEEHAAVGGDFYDAFLLPDGRLAVAIGDVQGHSIKAATVMAELRFALRAYLLEGHGPARALSLLNDLLLATHPEQTATVCVLVLSPDGAAAEVANAGHLPPLLVSGDRARYLEPSGPLLGVPYPGQVAETVDLTGVTGIVLTTDGLIERRDLSLSQSLRDLGARAAAATGTPAEIAEELLGCFPSPEHEDDVALLVLTRTAG